jgi:hypothetical protein
MKMLGTSFQLVLADPLMTVIRQRETNCVAGCCGTDAFDRTEEHMLPWLREHRKELFLVLDQMSDTVRVVGEHVGGILSDQDQFNARWNGAKECVRFLGEWRETILNAAEIVYGQLTQINLAWRTSDAVALARGIYDDRAFDRMPILADALEDAGCDNADILSHCRDTKTPHARGCWVVDGLLENV